VAKERTGRTGRLSGSKVCVFGMVAGCAFLALLGCESSADKDRLTQQQKTHWAREKSELEAQAAQIRERNEALETQVKHLLGLGPQSSLAQIDTVKRISVTRRSGLFDRDRDGTYEKLIVYIQPIDADGDVVKAPGALRVRVLDLDATGDEILVKESSFEPSQVRKLWVAGFMTAYYRVVLEADEKIAKLKELTVRAQFTDYVTGKVHTAQQLIKP